MATTVENVQMGRSRASTVELRPAIVLNLFHSGLAIARQLCAAGVRVVGLSAHPHIYGNYTRSCEVRTAPNSQEQPEELSDYLMSVGPQLRGALIFPTRDADVLFLDRFRADLEPLYKLAIPSRETLLRVVNKAVLAETALAAGVPTPRTAVVFDCAGLLNAAEIVGFPCVVKPVRSLDWRQAQNWKIVGCRKAFRANNSAQLQGVYERVSRAGSEILLQEWIPGDTNQIVVWGGLFGRHSEVLGYFTARKIVQFPAEFGTGAVVESCPIPDLLEPSSRLGCALGYEGIAEIEYKRDPRDGTLKLIEVNARHWDWHQLGEACQVNLTWAAYCRLSGRRFKTMHPSSGRAKWVAEDVFLTNTLSSLYRGGFAPRQMWNQLSGKRMYGISAWQDPAPVLRYAMGSLFPRVARAAYSRIRRG